MFLHFAYVSRSSKLSTKCCYFCILCCVFFHLHHSFWMIWIWHPVFKRSCYLMLSWTRNTQHWHGKWLNVQCYFTWFVCISFCFNFIHTFCTTKLMKTDMQKDSRQAVGWLSAFRENKLISWRHQALHKINRPIFAFGRSFTHSLQTIFLSSVILLWLCNTLCAIECVSTALACVRCSCQVGLSFSFSFGLFRIHFKSVDVQCSSMFVMHSIYLKYASSILIWIVKSGNWIF